MIIITIMKQNVIYSKLLINGLNIKIKKNYFQKSSAISESLFFLYNLNSVIFLIGIVGESSLVND